MPEHVPAEPVTTRLRSGSLRVEQNVGIEPGPPAAAVEASPSAPVLPVEEASKPHVFQGISETMRGGFTRIDK